MITCDGVTKRYGATRGLDNLTWHTDGPGIYCLLGRNGAGKTTLFRTLAGRTDATGHIQVAGHRPTITSPPPGVRFVEGTAPQFNLALCDLFACAGRPCSSRWTWRSSRCSSSWCWCRCCARRWGRWRG